jgi:hypothetical protein
MSGSDDGAIASFPPAAPTSSAAVESYQTDAFALDAFFNEFARRAGGTTRADSSCQDPVEPRLDWKLPAGDDAGPKR